MKDSVLVMQQLVLDIGMAPEPSFEGYLSTGNEAALQTLRDGVTATARLQAQSHDIAQGMAAPPPVYLWGSAGTGKTHLLAAVALALQAQGLAVGWLRPGLKGGRPYAREFNAHWSAVLIDDVDHLSAAEQQRAFNWFINATYPSDSLPCWIVATGNAPPVDLAMRDDLRSRLGSGLSFELQALNDAQRQHVLQRQAKERGLHLSNEVAQYLLGRFARDLSSLSELLGRLDIHAMRTQRAITIPLLREVLHDTPAGSDNASSSAP